MGNTIVRSFSVQVWSKRDVVALAEKLDQQLCSLQKAGWEIMSVTSTPVEMTSDGIFKSTLFTIVAKHTVETK